MSAPETLHNGIRLTEDWPPDPGTLPKAPLPVPYLEVPPEVIPIDLGRQLFVDDFLVERCSLVRTYHQPQPHPGNPILKPETAWGNRERALCHAVQRRGVVRSDGRKVQALVCGAMRCSPPAMPSPKMAWPGIVPSSMSCPAPISFLKSPGIRARSGSIMTKVTRHADSRPCRPARKRFRCASRCAAMHPTRLFRAGSSTAVGLPTPISRPLTAFTGPREPRVPGDQGIGDRSTFWFDPFRKVWVFSIRGGQTPEEHKAQGLRRGRTYKECTDLEDGLAHLSQGAVNWIGADDLDPPNPDYKDFRPQLYTLDAVAYESLMVGLFSVHQGPERQTSAPRKASRSATRFRSATAVTASTGTGRTDGPSSRRIRRTAIPGTGGTSSRPVAASSSSATGCTSTIVPAPSRRAIGTAKRRPGLQF